MDPNDIVGMTDPKLLPSLQQSGINTAKLIELGIDVRTVLDTLSTQERRVVELLYGFHGKSCTPKRTARILCITLDAVKQHEANAIEKMRKPLSGWSVT
jgi:DNA-directed RNA polymerase sigma subunit (sigma70/sigma32)